VRPVSVPTLVLGHPLVSVPLFLSGAALLFASWQLGSDGFGPAVVVLICLARVAHCSQQVSEYRAWKRAWAGMTERGHRPALIRPRRLLELALALLLAVYGSLKLDSGEVELSPTLAAIPLALLVLWAGAHGLRRRLPRGRQRDCVSVAVGASLMRVPTLAQAYRALPQHCQRVLGDRVP
jgi:hypothetical protein